MSNTIIFLTEFDNNSFIFCSIFSHSDLYVNKSCILGESFYIFCSALNCVCSSTQKYDGVEFIVIILYFENRKDAIF